MNGISELQVKLLIAEKIRQADQRRIAAQVRPSHGPSRVSRAFGLRAPLLQGA